MPPRHNNPNARRDYRHFPAEYTALLLAFERDGRASLGPMSRSDAATSRRDLYRFKTFLSHACDTSPDDAHARHLMEVFASCSIKLEPVATLPPNASHLTHLLNFTLNPIVAAVRQAEGHTPPAAPSSESPATPATDPYEGSNL